MNALKSLSNHEDIDFDLNKIHFDQKILDLVLTYYVNYDLSSRKTALILRQVHGVKISHQTVIYYASKVSKFIKPFVDNYSYKLTSTLSGDKTSIKVIPSYTIYATVTQRMHVSPFMTVFPNIRTSPRIYCLLQMVIRSIMQHSFSFILTV